MELAVIAVISLLIGGSIYAKGRPGPSVPSSVPEPPPVASQPVAPAPLPLAPPSTPSETPVPSLRVQGMPWGGRVYLNGVLATGGRWEDEPAKKQWRVNASVGPVVVEVADAAGVRRIATTEIPDPSRGFATVVYADMGATVANPRPGTPTVRDVAQSGSVAVFRETLPTPGQTQPVTIAPFVFFNGIESAGSVVAPGFDVEVRYEPGTYFRTDRNGVWDSPFLLQVQRGPSTDAIESETVFSVAKATGSDNRVAQSTYDALPTFQSVAYRGATPQRGYLADRGTEIANASLFAMPSLPIASKASRAVRFHVETSSGRITIRNDYRNGGVEEAIGVRRDAGEFFASVQTRAASPNGFVITRPPSASEANANYVRIEPGASAEFSLAIVAPSAISAVASMIFDLGKPAAPAKPAPAESSPVGAILFQNSGVTSFRPGR